MQVLLVNQNATIERLVSLSTGKLLYSLDKVSTSAEAESKDYDFIIMDSDLYDASSLNSLKNSALGATIIMIVSKGFERPNGVDIFIEKPFLPTELVDILSTARTVEPLSQSADMADLTSLEDFGDNLESNFAPLEVREDTSRISDDLSFDDDMDIASMDDATEPNLDFSLEESAGNDADNSDDEIVLDDIAIPYMDEEISVNDDSSPVSSDDFVLEDAGDMSDDLEDLNLDELNLGDVSLPADTEDEDFTSKPTIDDELGLESLEEPISIDSETDGMLTPESELAVDDEIKLDDLDELSLGDLSLDDDLGAPTDEIALDDMAMPSIDLDELGLEATPICDDEIALDDTKDETALDDTLDDIVLDDDFSVNTDSEEEELEEQKPSTNELLADFADLDDELLNDSTMQEDEVEISDEELIAAKPVSNDEDSDEEAPKVPSSIFGDDEVQKLKDLLGDGEEDLDSDSTDDTTIDDTKTQEPVDIGADEQDDEFGSMSEAGVAEALGMDYQTKLEDEIETIDLEELPDTPSVPVVTKPADTQVEQLQISGSDLLSMPISRLKELLEAADITINITLKKKSNG